MHRLHTGNSNIFSVIQTLNPTTASNGTSLFYGDYTTALVAKSVQMQDALCCQVRSQSCGTLTPKGMKCSRGSFFGHIYHLNFVLPGLFKTPVTHDMKLFAFKLHLS